VVDLGIAVARPRDGGEVEIVMFNEQRRSSRFHASEEEWFSEHCRRRRPPLKNVVSQGSVFRSAPPIPAPPRPIGDELADRWFR
jgi:hypothetical protein